MDPMSGQRPHFPAVLCQVQAPKSVSIAFGVTGAAQLSRPVAGHDVIPQSPPAPPMPAWAPPPPPTPTIEPPTPVGRSPPLPPQPTASGATSAPAVARNTKPRATKFFILATLSVSKTS